MNIDQTARPWGFQHPIVSENLRVPIPAPPSFIAEDRWRIDRLQNVWSRVIETVGQLGNHHRNVFAGAIAQLADCKGTLEVVWRSRLARTQFEGVLVGAWEAENECLLAHEYLA